MTGRIPGYIGVVDKDGFKYIRYDDVRNEVDYAKTD